MRTIELVARVTPDSAQALWYDLESGFDAGPDAAKAGVDLNASGVRHLSAAAVQVLLVAHMRAARQGVPFRISAPSDECRTCLRQMGASALIGEAPQ